MKTPGEQKICDLFSAMTDLIDAEYPDRNDWLEVRMAMEKAWETVRNIGWYRRVGDLPSVPSEVKYQRAAIPSEIREAVLTRDGATCRYCGTTTGPFEMDHVVPVIAGGCSDGGNLVTACRPCNGKKGPRTPAEAGMVLRDWAPVSTNGTEPVTQP